MEEASSNKYLRPLDGMRGLAIACVVSIHYGFELLKNNPAPLASAIARITSVGWAGVDLFFVLSGFLIGGLLLDQKLSPNILRTFWIRRACRILPLYFLTLAAFVVLGRFTYASHLPFEWLFDTSPPLWRFLTFTQNFWAGHEPLPHFIFVTWSLAVEEQFYLLLPFVVIYLPRRQLGYICATAIFVAPITRSFSPGLDFYFQSYNRADSLFAGVFVALLLRHPGSFLALKAHLREIKFGAFLLAFGFIVIALRFPKFNMLAYSWLALFFSLILLIVILDPLSGLTRFFGNRLLVWLGQISFGVYLFHEVLSGVFHGAIRKADPEIQTVADAAVSGLALIATLILAAIAHELIERPAIGFGRRFKYRSPPATKTAIVSTVSTAP